MMLEKMARQLPKTSDHKHKHTLPPKKLRCLLKGTMLKGNFIFQPSIFREYMDMLVFRGVTRIAMMLMGHPRNIHRVPSAKSIYSCKPSHARF